MKQPVKMVHVPLIIVYQLLIVIGVWRGVSKGVEDGRTP
jgi:hypothetical protein